MMNSGRGEILWDEAMEERLVFMLRGGRFSGDFWGGGGGGWVGGLVLYDRKRG